MSKFAVFLFKQPARNFLFKNLRSACANYATVTNVRNERVLNLRFAQLLYNHKQFNSVRLPFSTTSFVSGKKDDCDDACSTKPLQKHPKKRKRKRKHKGGGEECEEETSENKCRKKRREKRCEKRREKRREKRHEKRREKRRRKKHSKHKEAEECPGESAGKHEDVGLKAREKCRAKQALKEDTNDGKEKQSKKTDVFENRECETNGDERKKMKTSTACKPRVKRYRDPYAKAGFFAKLCGPKQCETMAKYIIGAVIFYLASALLFLYFTDWNPFKGAKEDGGKKEKKKCKKKSADSNSPIVAVEEGEEEQEQEDRTEGVKERQREVLDVECVCKDHTQDEEH